MNDTILREIFIETLYGAAAVDTEVKFKGTFAIDMVLNVIMLSVHYL
jgi:hypothetical protein